MRSCPASTDNCISLSFNALGLLPYSTGFSYSAKNFNGLLKGSRSNSPVYMPGKGVHLLATVLWYIKGATLTG